MPKPVRTAYLDIIQSNEIYPIDVMKMKYTLDEEIVKSWFVYRLASVGWIKFYAYKQRRYYYNPSRPEKLIAELVPRIHQKEVVKSILDNSTLGSAFEEQAIFYFTMYLIKRYKLQIRLNSEFPKKIPSWFNKDSIHKYTDEKGKRLVDVWKFDNDPIDYLIYVYDDIMDVPIAGYVVSIKRDKKGKYLGMAGKNCSPYHPGARYNWIKKKPLRTVDLTVIERRERKDNQGWVYTLAEDSKVIGTASSKLDITNGQTVEVGYDMKYPKDESFRLRFPKILRVRVDK